MRFERLIVLEEPPKIDGQHRAALVRCDCGVEKVVYLSGLTSGRIKSCGCYNLERIRAHEPRRTHGMRRTAEYSVWTGMKTRCYNPNDKKYGDYGGRGIKVCDRWLGPGGFVNFMSDMGPRPSPKHSIDRLNNELGYEPSNCAWRTTAEQCQNTRRTKLSPEIIASIRSMTAAGMRQKDVARQLGLPKWSVQSVATRRTWKNVA